MERGPKEPTDINEYRTTKEGKTLRDKARKILGSIDFEIPEERREAYEHYLTQFLLRRAQNNVKAEPSNTQIVNFLKSLDYTFVSSNSEGYDRKTKFEHAVRDIERLTGINKLRELGKFVQTKTLNSLEDDKGLFEANGLSDDELINELRKTNQNDWELRPRYYKIVFRRIREAMGKKE